MPFNGSWILPNRFITPSRRERNKRSRRLCLIEILEILLCNNSSSPDTQMGYLLREISALLCGLFRWWNFVSQRPLDSGPVTLGSHQYLQRDPIRQSDDPCGQERTHHHKVQCFPSFIVLSILVFVLYIGKIGENTSSNVVYPTLPPK